MPCIVIFVVLLVACSNDSVSSAGQDAGGQTEGGQFDSGQDAEGQTEGGQFDADKGDGGQSEGGPFDAELGDGGQSEGGQVDAELDDGGQDEGGQDADIIIDDLPTIIENDGNFCEDHYAYQKRCPWDKCQYVYAEACPPAGRCSQCLEELRNSRYVCREPFLQDLVCLCACKPPE